MMRKVRYLAVGAGVFFLASTVFAGIANTPHNLSSSGPLTTHQTSRICVFCHYPHDANPAVPLWNHQLPASTTYDLYWSNTIDSTYPSGPTGANLAGTSSLLCLSCHDGTVAVGALQHFNPGTTTPAGGVDASGYIQPTTTTYLGTDLTNDHPVEIIYGGSAADPALRDSTATIPNCTAGLTVGDLLRDGRVVCASCHNPHLEVVAGTTQDDCGDLFTADTAKHFMRIDLGGSKLCFACHNK